jgi:choline dehydrogenase-like flavoprotein
VPGLRVIDATVAPTPVTGNTAGVSMLTGAKGASLLLGGGSRRR